jgi:hypothetical protein
MRPARALLATLLAGGTALAAAATALNVGVEQAEEPQGISLRQDSPRAPGHGFFLAYRSHRSGGLRGGK